VLAHFPTRRVLGVQLFGHRHTEVAKRIDMVAAALFNEMTVDAISELDLSYTPPPESTASTRLVPS
jgi:hypothetical protein